jgi:eukaryotic-like serine/threonine-protein kinase
VRPGVVVGKRFEVVAAGSSGGMGAVYRGLDRTTGRPVAIKLVDHRDPHAGARFAREAAALAGVSHPGVVRYIAHGRMPDGVPYLVMDWVEGRTLESRMGEDGLTLGEAVDVTRKIAEALAAVHARGLVHRDVKPGNVIFPADEAEPVLIDFGLARRVAGGDRLTRSGAVLGTPGFMAPEQTRGVVEVTPATDVFSLGCLLYACATGRHAFIGTSPLATCTKVLLDPPEPMAPLCPEAPAALLELVDRMLAKPPETRPPGGREVADALAALGAIPAGPRRLISPEPPTTERVTPARPRVLGVVVVAPGADTGDLEPIDLEAAHGEAMREGGRLAAGFDGSIAVVFDGTIPEEVAARSARCALALLPVAADRPVSLSVEVGAAGGDPVDGAIDRGLLAEGDTGRGVRVDEQTARYLQGHVAMIRDRHGWLLAR